MPHNHYKGKLTHREIIKLVDTGVYIVDIYKGTVSSGKTEKELFTFPGNTEGYAWVRVYNAPKMRSIAVSNLVWIKGARATIPKNFEIHHRDLDITNNAYYNLFALHKDDHAKLHGRNLIEEFEEVPF